MQNKIESVVESGRIPVFLTSETTMAKLDTKQEKVVKSEKIEKEEDSQKLAEMVQHGFGVLEDHKGDIWYAQDGVIYKNATNAEDKVVQRFMSKKV